MNVLYKMLEKKDNLNPDDQKKQGYYPVSVRRKTVRLHELCQMTTKRGAINEIELEMAALILIESIKAELRRGNYVMLDDFGTFSLSLQSRNVETPDELRAESISVKKVVFKQSQELLRDLGDTSFERYNKK